MISWPKEVRSSYKNGHTSFSCHHRSTNEVSPTSPDICLPRCSSIERHQSLMFFLIWWSLHLLQSFSTQQVFISHACLKLSDHLCDTMIVTIRKWAQQCDWVVAIYFQARMLLGGCFHVTKHRGDHCLTLLADKERKIFHMKSKKLEWISNIPSMLN